MSNEYPVKSVTEGTTSSELSISNLLGHKNGGTVFFFFKLQHDKNKNKKTWTDDDQEEINQSSSNNNNNTNYNRHENKRSEVQKKGDANTTKNVDERISRRQKFSEAEDGNRSDLSCESLATHTRTQRMRQIPTSFETKTSSSFSLVNKYFFIFQKKIKVLNGATITNIYRPIQLPMQEVAKL
ncbi:hypothetical protein RFI_24064, partial [Reticulomyxa filosa]